MRIYILAILVSLAAAAPVAQRSTQMVQGSSRVIQTPSQVAQAPTLERQKRVARPVVLEQPVSTASSVDKQSTSSESVSVGGSGKAEVGRKQKGFFNSAFVGGSVKGTVGRDASSASAINSAGGSTANQSSASSKSVSVGGSGKAEIGGTRKGRTNSVFVSGDFKGTAGLARNSADSAAKGSRGSTSTRPFVEGRGGVTVGTTRNGKTNSVRFGGESKAGISFSRSQST